MSYFAAVLKSAWSVGAAVGFVAQCCIAAVVAVPMLVLALPAAIVARRTPREAGAAESLGWLDITRPDGAENDGEISSVEQLLECLRENAAERIVSRHKVLDQNTGDVVRGIAYGSPASALLERVYQREANGIGNDDPLPLRFGPFCSTWCLPEHPLVEPLQTIAEIRDREATFRRGLAEAEAKGGDAPSEFWALAMGSQVEPDWQTVSTIPEMLDCLRSAQEGATPFVFFADFDSEAAGEKWIVSAGGIDGEERLGTVEPGSAADVYLSRADLDLSPDGRLVSLDNLTTVCGQLPQNK